MANRYSRAGNGLENIARWKKPCANARQTGVNCYRIVRKKNFGHSNVFSSGKRNFNFNGDKVISKLKSSQRKFRQWPHGCVLYSKGIDSSMGIPTIGFAFRSSACDHRAGISFRSSVGFIEWLEFQGSILRRIQVHRNALRALPQRCDRPDIRACNLDGHSPERDINSEIRMPAFSRVGYLSSDRD